jgi:hypothetical protein
VKESWLAERQDTSTVDIAVQILLGCIALLAGRNLFWLFIAAIGFLVGFEFASAWLQGHNILLIIGIGIAAGLVGAILANVFERVGFALAGFYAAAYLLIMYAPKLGFPEATPVMIVVAGAIGALVTALLTDWAIIVLSSLAGAAAIVSAMPVSPSAEVIILVALAILGIAVQGTMLSRRLKSAE